MDSTPSQHFLDSYTEFKSSLPPKVASRVNHETFAAIYAIEQEDEEHSRTFRENLTSYAQILKEGKWKLDEYVSAVRYVTNRLLGKTIVDSYRATFPERIVRLMKKATKDGIAEDNKDKRHNIIRLYADNYHRNKLVVKIMGQTMVPTHILNAPLYQESINTLATLMRTSGSERIKLDSAEALLTKLAPPEESLIKVDIGISSGEEILSQIRSATMDYAIEQKKAIESGAISVEQASAQKIIDVVAEES